MQEAFIFMAICGVVYAAYALLSLGMVAKVHRDEIRRKEGELVEQSQRGGLLGFGYRIGQPLYWIVSLPFKSVPAALGMALLMVLPAFLTR